MLQEILRCLTPFCLVMLVACTGGVDGVDSVDGGPDGESGPLLFEDLSGDRDFMFYTPDQSRQMRTIVLVHGCSQTAAEIFQQAKAEAFADEHGMAILSPGQRFANNPSLCWNWHDEDHQTRDGIEPKAIVASLDALIANDLVDSEHVIVVGLSSGGGMATVLAVTYPDRFLAVATFAGFAYKAATSLVGLAAATSNGGPDPEEQGRLAFDAMGQYARRMPALVVTGDDDGLVAPINSEHLVTQWRMVHNLIDDEEENGSVAALSDEVETLMVPDGRSYEVREIHDDAGLLIQKIDILGADHVWPGGDPEVADSDVDAPDGLGLVLTFIQSADIAF